MRRTGLALGEFTLTDYILNHLLHKSRELLMRAVVVGDGRLVDAHARHRAVAGQILRGEVEMRLYN